MTNPLKSHFRQPVISFELPSKGDFWPDLSIDISASHEVEILPMTAADEIMLRTPDLLMNGTAVSRLLESCIPAIKDGSKCPIIDLEPLLISIRIASVSDVLDVSVRCPKCGADHDYEVDLRSTLDSIHSGNWKQPLVIGDLEFYFKPLTLAELNVYNNLMFKNQRLAKQIEMIEDEVEKEQLSNGIIKEMNATKVQRLVQSIKGIMVGSEFVSNKDHIAEYLMSCEKKVYDQVKNRFEDLLASTKAKNSKLQCSECQHEFEIPLTLDYASFFV